MVQFFPLLCCDLSVFAFSDPVQSQIHDPDPFQLLYLISQIPAHSADLPVQSLSQDNPECLFPCFFHFAGSCQLILHRYSAFCHSIQEPGSHGPVHTDQILFLMIISCSHHFIQDLSIICHEKQPLRILIQAPHVKNSFRVMYQFLDGLISPAFICGTHNPSGFIYRQKHHFFFFRNVLSIHQNLLFFRNLLTGHSH